jgi:hypothetical protein
VIYFKKIYFTDPDKEHTELAMRKFASKGISSTTNIGTNKLWVGQEGKTATKFTRIRYFIEGYLPKIIISIPHDKEANYMRIRLSIVPTLVLCFIAFNGLLLLMVGAPVLNCLIYFSLCFSVFAFLVFVEFKLTTKRISKTINAFNKINTIASNGSPAKSDR